MLFVLILFGRIAFAQDSAVEEFCFSSSTKMLSSLARLKPILLPVDRTAPSGHCFIVTTPSHRRELLQEFVRRGDPSARVSFSSAEIRRELCEIQVEKILDKISQANAGEMTTSGVDLSANRETQTISSVTQVKTNKEFELSVNQEVIKGECRFITPERYEITLQVRKVALPLPPPNVIIPGYAPPKQQETGHLQTELQLNRGQKIEVGSMIKIMRKDQTKADLKQGVELGNSETGSTEKVYLSIR